MKKLLLAALALWSCSSFAGPLSEPVTVTTFVQDFRPTPEAHQPKRTPQQFLRYQKAQGFIDGVKAATEGKTWCYDHVTHPVELDNAIYHRLKGMSPSRQLEEAGPVIAQQLALLYPCKARQP